MSSNQSRSHAEPDRWVNTALSILRGSKDGLTIEQLKRAERLLLRAQLKSASEGMTSDILDLRASTHYLLFDQSDELRDLRTAIFLCERVIALGIEPEKRRTACLTMLVTGLWQLYLHTDSRADLDRAVVVAEAELDRIGPNRSESVVAVKEVLIRPLLSRYRISRNERDLTVAARFASNLFEQEPPSDAFEHEIRLQLFADVKEKQYFASGSVTYLDEAITAFEELGDDNHFKGFHLATLLSLMGLYRLRYRNGGGRSCLDKAIALAGVALRVTTRHSARAEAVVAYAELVRIRFESFGRIEDLDEAIELLGSCDKREWTVLERGAAQFFFVTLAACLRTRYDALGSISDLRSALEASEKLLDVASDVLTARASSELSSCYVRIAEAFESAEAADRSIEFARQALKNSEPPNIAGLQSNLANCLIVRYNLLGQESDLTGSIDEGYAALKALRSTDQNNGQYLINQATRLMRKYELVADNRILEEAAVLAQRAIANTPKAHSSLAGRLNFGGRLLWELGQTNDAYETQAIDAWERCASLPSEDAYSRFHAACRIGYAMAVKSRWRDAAIAYRSAIELFPDVVFPDLDHVSRARRLSRISTVPLDGAIAAIRADDLTTALRVFEEGRTIWWKQTSDAKVELDALRQDYPELAQRFDRIRQRLRLLIHDDWLSAEEFPTSVPTIYVKSRSQSEQPKSEYLMHVGRGGDALLKAHQLHRVALELRQRGSLEEAIEKYEEAISLLVGEDEPVLTGVILVNYGVGLRRAGRTEEGLEAYRRAVDLFRKQNELLWEAKALQNLGIALLDQARNTEACMALERAAELFGSSSTREAQAHAAECSCDLGNALVHSDPAKAIRILEIGIDQLRQLDMDFDPRPELLSLAECYDSVGRNEEAANVRAQLAQTKSS